MKAEPVFKRLQSRFVIYLSVVLLSVIGATNYWLYTDRVEHLRASLDQAAESKLGSLVSLSGYYLRHFEIELLVELGVETTRQQGVSYLAIYDPDGTTYYLSGNPDPERTRSYQRDILWEGEKLGRLELALDITQYRKALRNALVVAVGTGLVSIVALGGLLFFFFRSQVLAEVEKIKQEEVLVREEHSFFNAVIDTSESLVVVADLNGNIILINRAASKARGSSQEKAIGQLLWDYFDIQTQGDDYGGETLAAKDAIVLQIENILDAKCQSRLPAAGGHDETVIEWAFTYLPGQDGQVKYIIATGTDVTEHLQAQVRLKQEAYHDLLTGLPNRALFQDRLEQAARLALRHKEVFALLYLDLDKFKPINDSLGHEAGDHVLQVLAKRMRGCLRTSDTVARLGGDEFGVILPQVHNHLNAGLVAEKLIRALNEPIDYERHSLQLGASIGIAVFPNDGKDLGELLNSADKAMYQAKLSGRNTYRFLNPPLGDESGYAI